MSDPILHKLAALGLDPAPAAAPPPWFSAVSVEDSLVFLSGQVPFRSDGTLLAVGSLGAEVSTDVGVQCARQCGANALATLSRGLGGLHRIRQILKVTVFVSSTADFADHPLVANGASEVLYEVLGEAGRHSRSAVGVASLPLSSPVEVELVAALVEDRPVTQRRT